MKKVKQHKAAKTHEETWEDGVNTYLVGTKRGKVLDTAISVSVTVKQVDAAGAVVTVGGEPLECVESVTIRKAGLPDDAAGFVAGILSDARQKALRDITARRRALEAWELIPEGDE